MAAIDGWPKCVRTKDPNDGTEYVRHGVLRAYRHLGSEFWFGQVLRDNGQWATVPGVYRTAFLACEAANGTL
jgi:hypothetical protein